jgi:hypothetical protein
MDTVEAMYVGPMAGVRIGKYTFLKGEIVLVPSMFAEDIAALGRDDILVEDYTAAAANLDDEGTAPVDTSDEEE